MFSLVGVLVGFLIHPFGTRKQKSYALAPRALQMDEADDPSWDGKASKKFTLTFCRKISQACCTRLGRGGSATVGMKVRSEA
jgi:hypothetical protein